MLFITETSVLKSFHLCGEAAGSVNGGAGLGQTLSLLRLTRLDFNDLTTFEKVLLSSLAHIASLNHRCRVYGHCAW
jgi:hypothetical protein